MSNNNVSSAHTVTNGVHKMTLKPLTILVGDPIGSARAHWFDSFLHKSQLVGLAGWAIEHHPGSKKFPSLQKSEANLMINEIRDGAKYIIETHSTYFLNAILAAVGEGRLRLCDVVIYWISPKDGYPDEVLIGQAGNLLQGWPDDLFEIR